MRTDELEIGVAQIQSPLNGKPGGNRQSISAEAMEEVSARYLGYVDMAYRVALRFAGDRVEARCLAEDGLARAIAEECTDEKGQWVKSRLLRHLRRAFLDRNSDLPRG